MRRPLTAPPAAAGPLPGPRPRPRARRQPWFLAALVVAVVLVAVVAGLFDGPELAAVDLAFRLRGAQPPASPVVIVAIDDNTFAINRLQWPWPRTYFAQIVDRLSAGGASLVAFDVFFNEPEDFGKPATYTVRGETLTEIAQQSGLTAAEILTANNLPSGAALCGGQVLTLPTNPPGEHAVQRDTLDGLAARYQVTPAALLRANHLTNPCAINPGDLLLIPIIGPVNVTVAEGDTTAKLADDFQVNPLALTDAAGAPAQDPLVAGSVVSVHFGDDALASAITAAGNVVLNGEIASVRQAGGTARTLVQPIAALMSGARGFGLTNVQADADGAVHSILAWDQSPMASQSALFTWPLVVAAEFSGQPLDPNPTAGALRVGSQTVPLDLGYLRLNFRGPEGAIPTYSALQVVNGDLPLSTFAGKIVLIGATAQSLHDIYATPFVPNNPPGLPGVEVMANALDTVLSGQYLRSWSGVCSLEHSAAGLLRCLGTGVRLPALLAVVLAGLGAVALGRIQRANLALGALAGALALLVLVWLGAFTAARVELPLVAPAVTLVAAFTLPAIERAVNEELEKRRVRSIFELFISPHMVGQLIEQGIDAMRGQRAELTMLFSDIRGFTTLSEKLTPEELVELLNEYLGAMTEVIHRNGGTVDKYEGDLVMAFFGAPLPVPDHAQRAVQTGIEMRQELDRLRQKWTAEGKDLKLEMGVGLNTGEVFVGLVGSGKRVNYTVMGDAVNLASRVQDLTKDFKWPVLITEFTYALIQTEFNAEYIESRQVKGKTVPVGIYRVLGRRGAPEAEKVRPLYA